MRYVKPLSVAIMAIGLSAPCLANDTLTIPSQHGGFKLSVDPLYLRSNATDTNYDWGTYAQIGYLFPATGNDLTVDYTYLRSGDKETLDLDSTDLEIGQRLTTGDFDVRVFSGARYTHLKYALDSSTSDNQESLNNLFHGFGPRAGLDARYQLGGFLGFDTHLSTSLLAGTISTHLDSQKGGSISQSMTRVVPEVDAKLGIDYTYPMPANKNAVVIEVGYQTTNYFNTFGGSQDETFDGAYLDVKYYA